MNLITDIDAASFWLDVAQWVLMLLLSAWAYQGRRHAAHAGELKVLQGQVTAMEQSLKIVESELANTLTHDHLNALRSRIEEVHAGQSELKGALQGIARAVDLMNQHLLSQSR